MNKYDFGYTLEVGSTIEWAFKQVTNNATVLELGPSNGNLIYHLTTHKKCIADIVEIDEEAGNQAAHFARNSCIGSVAGDLEKKNWYQTLKDNQYDFVLILDVLEHIHNPQEVLMLLTTLLTEHGKILVSIPNIAHNSVLINLLQNKFEYTAVGLLDDTHIHFFTYESAVQMIKDAGLFIDSCEARQIDVGNNEISAMYGNLPRDVDAYIKTRELGTAYQFLFTLSRAENNQSSAAELSYHQDTPYSLVAFDADQGTVLAQRKVNPLSAAELYIPLSANIRRLRIDPLDTNCIISHIILIGIDSQGTETELAITELTGNQFEDYCAFYDDDSQLYVDIPEGIERVRFSCQYNAFDSSALETLASSRDLIRQYIADYQQIKDLYEKTQTAIDTLTQQVTAEKAHSLQLLNDLNETRSKTIQMVVSEMSDIQEIKKKLLSENALLREENVQTKQELLKANNDIGLLNSKLEYQTQLIEELQKELDAALTSIWGKIYYKLNK